MAKRTVAKGEGPDEGPAVGMQLSRGHVELRKLLPLKTVEGESLTDALEHRLVKEKEWLPLIRAIINTDRFASCAGANRDVGIMYPPKGFS